MGCWASRQRLRISAIEGRLAWARRHSRQAAATSWYGNSWRSSIQSAIWAWRVAGGSAAVQKWLSRFAISAASGLALAAVEGVCGSRSAEIEAFDGGKSLISATSITPRGFVRLIEPAVLAEPGSGVAPGSVRGFVSDVVFEAGADLFGRSAGYGSAVLGLRGALCHFMGI